jgi:hypothetical protein
MAGAQLFKTNLSNAVRSHLNKQNPTLKENRTLIDLSPKEIHT